LCVPIQQFAWKMVENDEIHSVCGSLIWSIAKALHSATCFDTIWPFWPEDGNKRLRSKITRLHVTHYS